MSWSSSIRGALKDGTWWCRNDEVHKIKPSAADPTTAELTLSVPAIAADGCNSEIVVFTEGNAMAQSFHGLEQWGRRYSHHHYETDHRRASKRLDRQRGCYCGARRKGMRVDNATAIYLKNKVGVQFVAAYQNVSSNTKAVEVIGNYLQFNRWNPQQRLVHAKYAQHILRRSRHSSAWSWAAAKLMA